MAKPPYNPPRFARRPARRTRPFPKTIGLPAPRSDFPRSQRILASGVLPAGKPSDRYCRPLSGKDATPVRIDDGTSSRHGYPGACALPGPGVRGPRGRCRGGAWMAAVVGTGSGSASRRATRLARPAPRADSLSSGAGFYPRAASAAGRDAWPAGYATATSPRRPDRRGSAGRCRGTAATSHE